MTPVDPESTVEFGMPEENVWAGREIVDLSRGADDMPFELVAPLAAILLPPAKPLCSAASWAALMAAVVGIVKAVPLAGVYPLSAAVPVPVRFDVELSPPSVDGICVDMPSTGVVKPAVFALPDEFPLPDMI